MSRTLVLISSTAVAMVEAVWLTCSAATVEA